jgi:hypothetical protein
MGVDRDLGDLPVRRRVGASHLQRWGPGLDVEATFQRRWNEYCGDFLMNLNDTQAEQVFDQREDGALVAVQQPADRGKRAVDVVLGAT